MTDNNGKVILGIIVLLVLALKFGFVFSGSIYSGDPNYQVLNLVREDWALSNQGNIYSFCSPSKIRMDFHPTGTDGTCQPIVAYTTPGTISAVCDGGSCPDIKTDVVGIDEFYFECGGAVSGYAGEGKLSIVDLSGNEVMLFQSICPGTSAFTPVSKTDLLINYSGSSFHLQNGQVVSASNLDSSQKWLLKLATVRSTANINPDGYLYSSLGNLYKHSTLTIPVPPSTPPATPTSISFGTATNPTTEIIVQCEPQPLPAGTTSNYYRSTSSTGTFNLIGTGSGTSGGRIDNGLTPGTTYYYKCSFTNSAGTSSQSAVYSLSTTASCTSNWQTGAWSICSVSGTQTRTVTDANLCATPTTSTKPTSSQPCTYIEPSCDQSHTQGELFSTQCGSPSTLNQTSWTCVSTTWEKTNSLSDTCASGMECLGTASSCTAIPVTQTVSSGGGGGGSVSTTPTEPVVPVTPPVEPKTSPLALVAVIGIVAALIIRARRRR